MAASTTPASDHTHQRASSHSRTRSGAIPSRPTTPLRPPSRTSLRASQSTPTAGAGLGGNEIPLAALEPAFGEFSDAMADLEANMMHLQLLNESIGRFNENFGAFLYGMNMSAFCVDFPEAPIPHSFQRNKDNAADQLQNSPFPQQARPPDRDTEATFLTTDTSFIENPPDTAKKPASSKFSSVPSSTAASRHREAMAQAQARGAAARGRATGSGIARGTSSRGARGGGIPRAGSGSARGAGRGRGIVR
ncbi:hypothetical protein DOTSEDRAFT_138039 [Dothistroma septosporum NZE10]|uniref:DASH complex subunit DAM1 n=1 Tax=Dothistroma septosporum (strain NZE10 / CBS 128990) TaxID=675120 RepID=N1PDZ2_DOTSN|nr:hypothetical protein DOTSEDRAFT_138039 [Dothistroma septosporum NZE10]